MAPHGIAPLRCTAAKMRAVHFLLLVGMTIEPACAPMPTKPRATIAVSGRATDRTGVPIADVAVYFDPGQRSPQSFYPNQQARTDSTGSYSLEVVAGYWQVSVRPPPNVAFDYRKFDSRVIVSPEHSRFDFVFDGARVQGRVIDPTGAILDSGYVSASRLVGSPYGDDYAWTEVRGGRFFLLLPAGTYSFYASPRDFASGIPSTVTGDVTVQADTTIDIVMLGELVAGVVAGPGGAPLESLIVTASGQYAGSRARTGVDGKYALYAPPGDYRFILEPRPVESYILIRISSLRTINGPSTFDFDLSGVEWSGAVRSSATLLPIEGVKISAVLFADSYNRIARATSNASGQFRLVLEPNREYSLTIHSPGMEDLTYPGIFAAADTTFDILLDPAPVP